MTCVDCKHCVIERWPRERVALRCFNPAAGQWYGRTLDVYDERFADCLSGTAAPKWCPKAKEEKEK